MRSRSGFSSVESDSLSRPLSGAAADDGHCLECGDVIDTRVMLVDSFKASAMAQPGTRGSHLHLQRGVC